VAGFINVGWTVGGGRPETLEERLEQALASLSSPHPMRVVLLDLLGSAITLDGVLAVIHQYAKRHGWWRQETQPMEELPQPLTTTRSEGDLAVNSLANNLALNKGRGPAIVLRVLGEPSDETRELIESLPISLADSLEAAAKLTAVLASAPQA
jgi:hypothetical protein